MGGSRIRIASSALLAVTHLGLLGEGNRSLGIANGLSLVRANLPPRRWAAPVALVSDFVDGAFARGLKPTAFGSYADPLADLSFWGRRRPSAEHRHADSRGGLPALDRPSNSYRRGLFRPRPHHRLSAASGRPPTLGCNAGPARASTTSRQSGSTEERVLKSPCG
jgi:CDP-alcohol phosphatidyltransferase